MTTPVSSDGKGGSMASKNADKACTVLSQLYTGRHFFSAKRILSLSERVDAGHDDALRSSAQATLHDSIRSPRQRTISL